MTVRKTTLLNGAPKRPTTPTPHPHMWHVAAGSNEIHKPSVAKKLVPVLINPGCRSRNEDSLAGSVTPAKAVDFSAPGAVRSRRA